MGVEIRFRVAIADALRDERWDDIAALLSDADRPVDQTSRVLTELADTDELHRIRQAYLRHPDPHNRLSDPRPRRARRVVERLRTDGVVPVRRLFPRRRIRRIHDRVDLAFRTGEHAEFRHYDQEQYWRDDQQAWVFNDALAIAPELLALCRDPLLVTTAASYLGKPTHIKRVYGMRYLPKEQPESHQFGWHHDMEDRMVKVMVLLTDVPADGQVMSYVAGTHETVHPFSCFRRNALSFDQIGVDPASCRAVDTVGRAGDVFLFDPNGMHRGRRSLGAPRDAIFIEFTADANHDNVWGSRLGIEEPERFGPDADDPLHLFRDLRPKWERRAHDPRTETTWIESLGDPSRWLRR
ncbi:MAG: phytanoyl-CoA dioxygenase family protein [Acidimicrobiales bacterium]|nr:phytanoyl-CoA dioxygenase family protein [Acidimicrobiales bacterium]